MDAPGSKDAAVLVPLYRDPLTAVFTERRADLPHHAGEISFPGGTQDEPDEDLRVTALREAEEEIGLPPSAVEIVGALPPVGTFVTGYRIFPFVGTIERGHVWRPAEAEVAEVLEFGLSDLVAGMSGGVGLAAIQLAQLLGAEIYATAGSPEKRDLLQAAGLVGTHDIVGLANAGGDFTNSVKQAAEFGLINMAVRPTPDGRMQ